MEAYTHRQLMKSISVLRERYPFFAYTVIGKSLCGREIPAVIIGEGAPMLLYVGTHHGLEWITAPLLTDLCAAYGEAIPENRLIGGVPVGEIIRRVRIGVIPMLNPDGVELSVSGRDVRNPFYRRMGERVGYDFSGWQANGRGVDLNHNYDAGFDEYKKREASYGIGGPGPTRYSGEYPASEPETANLVRFIRREEPVVLAALHTQGREIYYDYNGEVPEGGEALAAFLGERTGYTLAKPEGAASYGGLKDWFIKAFHRPGFTLECGKGKNPLPMGTLSSIEQEVMGALTELPVKITEYNTERAVP